MSAPSFYTALFKPQHANTNHTTTTDTPHRHAHEGLHPYAQTAINQELDRLTTLPHPWHPNANWDTTTYQVACNLIELANSPWTGYTLPQAQHDLYNHAPADDQWGNKEHQQKWDSATKTIAGTGRHEPDPLDPLPEPTTITTPDLDPHTETDFWNTRPILQHIHNFARARRTSPWATLGVTLARIITATPHQVCLPPIIGGKGSINIFIGLVGPSGAGKGAAASTATDAIQITGIKTARLASGEAIAHLYKRRLTKPQQDANESEWNDTTRARLIDISEIDRFAAQTQRQGSTLMADLRAAWSGEMLGQIAADPTRSIILEPHSYRLTLVAGIQPHRAAVLLNDEDGGTPQRFIWFPVADPDAPNTRPPEPEPLTWTHPPLGQLASINGTQIQVPQTVINEIDAARIATLRQQNDPLDGHKLQSQLKAATALALADQRLAVNEEDWNLARTIIRKSDATRAAVITAMTVRATQDRARRAEGDAERAITVEDRMIDAAVTRVSNVIVKKLDRDGGTATHSSLRRAVASRDRDHFEDAIGHLTDDGTITPDQGGDGTIVYHSTRGVL